MLWGLGLFMKSNMAVHVVTSTKPTTREEIADGWGERAVKTVVEDATPMDITILVQDGKIKHPAISIRVHRQGDLTITNYGGCFTVDLDNNLRLENSRPWKNRRQRK